MYRLISPLNKADTRLLASMHNLRFRVFKQRLGWDKGDAISRMEFDEYDNGNAIYLVKVDPSDQEVSACTRLIQTTQPYLLANSFGRFLRGEPIRRPDCYETSRFVSDPEKSQPLNITGELVAAMLEFGTYNGISNYVSLSDIRIEKILLRCGWDPTPLGPPGSTTNETSIAFVYTVNSQMLENVRQRSKVSPDLIMNLKEFSAQLTIHETTKAA